MAARLDLGQDEAYTYTVTRAFQLSFFDHPPLSFWVSWAMQAIFGRDLSPLLLRWPFVAMFTGTVAATYALTAKVYGQRAGLWAATLLAVTPFFAASAGGWVMPDGPLMLFLVLAAWTFLRALDEQPGDEHRWRDWVLTGLFIGLALLSKYQAFLTLFGAFLLLLTPRHRRWLARPQPYVAIALALVVFTPVLVWNIQHDWVSFRFQLGRGGGGAGSGFAWIRMLVFESVYLWPWLAVAMVGAATVAVARRLSRAGFFLALALPPILLFNLQPLVGPAGQPHWSMAGWLFVYPLLGQLLAGARERGARWPLWLSGASGGAFVILVVAILALPLYYPAIANLKGADDFMRQSVRWSGVREALQARGLLGRPGTVLAATNWREGGSLGATVASERPIVVFSDDPRGFAFLDTPMMHKGEDAVFAVAPEEVSRTENLVRRYFATVDQITTVQTNYGGVPAFETVILLAHTLREPPRLPYGLPGR